MLWPPERINPIKGGIPYREWRSCSIKVKHSTEKKALEILAKMEEKNIKGLEVYFCENCYSFHLGHKRI